MLRVYAFGAAEVGYGIHLADLVGASESIAVIIELRACTTQGLHGLKQ